MYHTSCMVPWRCVHPRSVHPFTFFSVSAFLSTRRGPCRREAPSTARAALGDHEPLIGGARWRSMDDCAWVEVSRGRFVRGQAFLYKFACFVVWYLPSIQFSPPPPPIRTQEGGMLHVHQGMPYPFCNAKSTVQIIFSRVVSSLSSGMCSGKQSRIGVCVSDILDTIVSFVKQRDENV
jgi:hypothetical protein